MSRWYTEQDLKGVDLLWLLDLRIGGVVYRFCTEAITINDSFGNALAYQGTLSAVDFASEVEFGAADFDLPAASVTVTFREDMAKRIAQGVDFAAGSAELAIIRKGAGDDHDDRQVVLSGRLDAPSYGAIGEPVAFNIEADWLRSTSAIPEPGQVIDQAVNWPDAEDNVQGKIYPIIFGAPGQQGFAGSPIYIAEDTGSGTRVGLIAAHRCTAQTISVTEVQIDGQTPAIPDQTVQFALDANGAPYAFVDIPNAHFNADASYFASFDNGGGGLINPFAVGRDSNSSNTTAFLTGAGDVLRYLLHQSGAKVDDSRCAIASAALNAFEIEGYVAERVNVLDLVKELVELLPCSLRATADGIYPVVWRYDATKADCQITLEAGREVYRQSPVEYVSGPIYNEITLKYRHNARFNTLRKSVTVTGDLNKKTSGFVWSNVYTVSSFSRYGSRAVEFETELISSRATAGRVVGWMSRAYSTQHRAITYAAPNRLAFLQVGDVVALTDADLHLQEQVTLVQSIDYQESGLVITLLLISDPPKDTIPT